MKICAQCNSTFTEDHFFCLNDGSTLSEANTEQETVVSKRVEWNMADSVSLPEKATFCPSCGLENQANSKFCKKCGETLPAGEDLAEKRSFTPDSAIHFHLPQNASPPNLQPVQPLNFSSGQSNP